jgi:hypothetical protein
MSFKDEFKNIIGPSKEMLEEMKRQRQRPPLTLDEAERQLRASEAIQAKYKDRGKHFKIGRAKPDA